MSITLSPQSCKLHLSYRYCQKLARREAANFYHAFRLLPLQQRLSMCALYSFLRVTDDLADEPGTDNRAGLHCWQESFDRAMNGDYSHPLHPALHDTVRKHEIPVEYLQATLDGVRMDLDINRYATFEELSEYCYRVASVVGLSCIHIWGFSHPDALEYAKLAGIGFQLTNILRDLGEDAARGRIYLPREDLELFGYSEDALLRGEINERFKNLMRFQVQRAREHYEASEPLAGLLSRPGRAVFLVMFRTYRGILDVIEDLDYDVFHSRACLSRLKKLWLVLQVLPLRWGWF